MKNGQVKLFSISDTRKSLDYARARACAHDKVASLLCAATCMLLLLSLLAACSRCAQASACCGLYREISGAQTQQNDSNMLISCASHLEPARRRCSQLSLWDRVASLCRLRCMPLRLSYRYRRKWVAQVRALKLGREILCLATLLCFARVSSENHASESILCLREELLALKSVYVFVFVCMCVCVHARKSSDD